MSRKPVLNLEHAGASGYAPENTLAAFDLAVELGADGIELDAQATADGELVLLHDQSTDRTLRGPDGPCTGPVRSRTLAELRSCDAGSWFNEAYPERARDEYRDLKVPTLREVLDRYGDGLRYHVELKHPENTPGVEDTLLELLDGYPGLRVTVQSFRIASLKMLHALRPGLPLLQLYPPWLPPVSGEALEEVGGYAAGVAPWKDDVDRELASAVLEQGLGLYPYTANEEKELEFLVSLGVSGIHTDYPDRLRDLKRGE